MTWWWCGTLLLRDFNFLGASGSGLLNCSSIFIFASNEQNMLKKKERKQRKKRKEKRTRRREKGGGSRKTTKTRTTKDKQGQAGGAGGGDSVKKKQLWALCKRNDRAVLIAAPLTPFRYLLSCHELATCTAGHVEKPCGMQQYCVGRVALLLLLLITACWTTEHRRCAMYAVGLWFDACGPWLLRHSVQPCLVLYHVGCVTSSCPLVCRRLGIFNVCVCVCVYEPLLSIYADVHERRQHCSKDECCFRADEALQYGTGDTTILQ